MDARKTLDNAHFRRMRSIPAEELLTGDDGHCTALEEQFCDAHAVFSNPDIGDYILFCDIDLLDAVKNWEGRHGPLKRDFVELIKEANKDMNANPDNNEPGWLWLYI